MENYMAGIEKGLGMDIMLWFQSWRTDLVSTLFQPLNYAGTETFFLILITIVYWTGNKNFGRRLTIVFLISAWFNAFFKEWWKRPRPFQVSEKLKSAYPVDGYGLPSGHTQTATTFGSFILLGVRKRWATVLLVLYIFLTGISRMVHGVHFPQDVLLGWIIGILIIVVFIFLEAKFSRFFAEITSGQIIILTLMTFVIMLGLSFWTDPNLHGIGSLVTPAAVLVGAIPGFFIESKQVRFTTAGSFRQKCLRYLVGICIALLLKSGLKPLLEIINTHSLYMEAFIRFIRYFALGLWVSLGAPWLFVKTRLASTDTK